MVGGILKKETRKELCTAHDIQRHKSVQYTLSASLHDAVAAVRVQ